MVRNPNLLRSKLFLLGLVVLVLNDHYFKLAYPNWFTGKVSDFVGLFILPIFLTSLSDKSIKLNCLLAAVMFIIWKSPVVEPLITAGKSIDFPFHRTVDYTDLIALAVLPLSYTYVQTIPLSRVINKKLAINSFAVLCFISLASTSLAPNFAGTINKNYKFSASKSELLKEIGELNCELETEISNTGDSVYVLKNLVFENDSIIKTARFQIMEKENHSVLSIAHIATFHSYPAFFTWSARRKIRKVAEKYLIEEIK